MKSFAFTCCLALGMVIATNAKPAFAKIITYEELRSEVEKSNVAIRQATLDLEQAHQNSRRAKWALAPTASLSITRNHTVFTEDQPPTASRNQSLDQTLSLRWRLFDGLKGLRALDNASLMQLEAELGKSSRRLAITSRLTQFYINWQTAVARKALQDDLQQLRQATFDDISSRVARGEIDLQEKVLFENQLIESEERLVQTDNAIRSAIVDINKLAGRDIVALQDVKPQESSIFSAPDCDESQLNLAVNALNSSKLIATRRDIAKLSISDAEWSYAPALDFRADYNLGDQLLRPSDSHNLRFLLQLSWELFSGRSAHFSREDAVRKVNRFDLELQQLVFETDQQAHEICRRMLTNATRQEKMLRIAKNYEDLYQVAKRQFDNGEISALDLINFQANWVTSRLAIIDLANAQQQLQLELSTLAETL